MDKTQNKQDGFGGGFKKVAKEDEEIWKEASTSNGRQQEMGMRLWEVGWNLERKGGIVKEGVGFVSDLTTTITPLKHSVE